MFFFVLALVWSRPPARHRNAVTATATPPGLGICSLGSLIFPHHGYVPGGIWFAGDVGWHTGSTASSAVSFRTTVLIPKLYHDTQYVVLSVFLPAEFFPWCCVDGLKVSRKTNRREIIIHHVFL